MGIYSHITKNLPKYKGKDAQSQRIEETARLITLEPGFLRQASVLAYSYAELRTMKDILHRVSSDLELRLSAIQMLTVDQYENERTLSLALEDGVVFEAAQERLIDEIVTIKSTDMAYAIQPTVRMDTLPHGEVLDKEKFRLWCVRNGLGQQLMLWPTTTQKIVKELALHGHEPPDGIEVTALSKLILVKGG